jgi:hypothetical protein
MPEHHDLESPLGTPGVASEGYPTRHDMNVVRKSILLTEDGQIQRNMSDETFWDGVVANAVEILEPGRVSDILQTRLTRHHSLLAFAAYLANFPGRSSPLCRPSLAGSYG